MSIKDFFLAIFITFIWGVNFSIIKIGIDSLDPFILAGLRFTLCALPFVFFIKRPDVKFRYLLGYGLSFGVGLWGLAYLGIYFGMSAGLTPLVLQMGTFSSIIFTVILLNEGFSLDKKIGFIVSLLGVIAIIFVTDGSVTIIGLILSLFASLFLGATNVIAKMAKTKDIFSFLVWSSIFAPIPLFILAFFTSGSGAYLNFFTDLDNKAIFSILFQVYPTTLFGYWAYNSLIHKYDVSTIAPFGLLVPIFGLLGSHLLLDEQIGIIKIIACALIILGLLISNFGNRFFKEKKESL
ncbi:MAG: EamA family transporter [Arcobacter sp.]|nr:EamA family transporter [Arcobacter sp.]